ncbi:MAG: M3 family oligoendopeptidase [Bacteroidota bacterium]
MALTRNMPRRRKRHFVNNEFTVSDWENLTPYFTLLQNAAIETVEDTVAWLRQMSELEFVLNEDKAWRYIYMTRNTADEVIRKRYQYYVAEILPHVSVEANSLLEKLYGSPGFSQLDPAEYRIVIRSTRNRIELFREENVPLLTEISQESRKFDEIAAGLHIIEDGEKMTLQKAASLLEGMERGRREQVWRKVAYARYAHHDALNELFDRLIGLRHQVAVNADFSSYADYKFAELGRFDYTREDCYQFHDSIENVVRPLLERRSEQRQQNLGVDTLHHWDLTVDEFGQEPLKPFASPEELIDKTVRIFDRLDPRLGEQMQTMREMGHLDLDSRLHKAPGGYNYPLAESGVPFIFMNAVGTQSDLTTMLHECGHAIHSFATQHLEISAYKYLPSEIAELASMSMELITLDFLDEFYDDPEDLRRAKREQIIRPLTLLPWIAAVDRFQFWAYDHPGHSHEERAATWKAIYERFHGNHISWEGVEDVFGTYWQKQGHIFDVPFYYIEYGFAQLGAIAVWRNYRQNPEKGLNDYLHALSLGYTRPIPEVYEAAGIRFDFSEDYIRELMDFTMEELRKLEAPSA